MNTITRNLLGTLAGFSMLVTANLGASPLHVQLDGNIIGGTGNGVPFISSSMFADLYFDLDKNNALVTENFSPIGEPAFTRWTFSGGSSQVAPYNQTAFTSGFSTFGSPLFLGVETLDNFDADAAGNPFGITGFVDVLTISATTDTVDCSGGTIHPITGCSLLDAPVLGGEEHIVNFIANSNWFNGIDVLPASLLPFADFISVFGSMEKTEQGVLVASLEVEYTSQRVNGAATVPAPQTALLMLTGLLSMVAQRTRKRA